MHLRKEQRLEVRAVVKSERVQGDLFMVMQSMDVLMQ